MLVTREPGGANLNPTRTWMESWTALSSSEYFALHILFYLPCIAPGWNLPKSAEISQTQRNEYTRLQVNLFLVILLKFGFLFFILIIPYKPLYGTPLPGIPVQHMWPTVYWYTYLEECFFPKLFIWLLKQSGVFADALETQDWDFLSPGHIKHHHARNVFMNWELAEMKPTGMLILHIICRWNKFLEQDGGQGVILWEGIILKSSTYTGFLGCNALRVHILEPLCLFVVYPTWKFTSELFP